MNSITKIVTNMSTNTLNRFWGKVRKTKTCWNWIGAKRDGYGAIKIAGKLIATHRLSYELHNGVILKGLLVCHKCDNPACVNPKHLFLGTSHDNIMDAISKNRFTPPTTSQLKVHHKPFVSNFKSEASIQMAKDIIHNRGTKTLKQIAIELDISYYTVRDISCGRVYINN